MAGLGRAYPLIAKMLRKKKEATGHSALISPKTDASLIVGAGWAVLARFAFAHGKDRKWQDKAAKAEKILGCPI